MVSNVSGNRARPGRGLGTGPPQEPWFWLTATIVRSPHYQALGVSARRILDFLMCEHASHGGKENGNLAAPYEQLEAFGATAADISKGLFELEAMGFVTVTKKGMQVAGGGDPSRFRITFYAAKTGLETNPPSLNKHMTVLNRLVRDHGRDVRAMRAWLKREVQQSGVGGRRISKPASTSKAGTKI